MAKWSERLHIGPEVVKRHGVTQLARALALQILLVGAACTQYRAVMDIGDGGVDSSGASNTGGTKGTGGMNASGGATGAGGASGIGGATGSGGATGTGGATGVGGTTGAGGTTAAGGATGSGGASGVGGTTGTGGATVPPCAFASVNGTCVYPPLINTTSLGKCNNGPKLSPPVGATVRLNVAQAGGYTITCNPNCGDPTVTTINPQETLAQATNVPLVELFCLSEMNLPIGTTLHAGFGYTDGQFIGQRSIAFLVKGPVTIAGAINLDGATTDVNQPLAGAGGPGAAGGYRGGTGTSMTQPGPGSGPCGGNPGNTVNAIGSGASGGGNATVGAAGAVSTGGPGALATCSRTFMYLEGGSGGGAGGYGNITCSTAGVPCTPFPSFIAGAGGGGAIEIASTTSITISGSLTANGGDAPIEADTQSGGYFFVEQDLGGAGAGGGGSILLASPSISVSGTMTANGGKGGTVYGNVGGAGATGLAAAMVGMPGNTTTPAGAGGGGGVGFVRLFGASSCPTAGCFVQPLSMTPAP